MGQPVQESPSAWARLRVDVNCGLRRGAWYRVVNMTRDQAVLEVTADPLPVRRRLVQMVFRRPFRWTVVPRPQDAANLPSEWGARYAVCPVCHTRAPITGHPFDLPCPHCHGVFALAWDERYLTPG